MPKGIFAQSLKPRVLDDACHTVDKPGKAQAEYHANNRAHMLKIFRMSRQSFHFCSFFDRTCMTSCRFCRRQLGLSYAAMSGSPSRHKIYAASAVGTVPDGLHEPSKVKTVEPFRGEEFVNLEAATVPRTENLTCCAAGSAPALITGAPASRAAQANRQKPEASEKDADDADRAASSAWQQPDDGASPR